MGRVGGKVAFITGAARGQGREHAVRLAEEGAKIIAIDICRDIPTAPYGGATPDDLAQTVKQVEAIGGEILSRQVDVRDSAALDNVVAEGIQAFGAIDIVSVNAGIAGYVPALDMSDEVWQEMIDTLV
jgi:(+)-trans-carveol dehydrogenase